MISVKEPLPSNLVFFYRRLTQINADGTPPAPPEEGVNILTIAINPPHLNKCKLILDSKKISTPLRGEGECKIKSV
jgi:hypothetical protein